MKRLFVAAIAFIFLGLAAVYVIIPKEVNVSSIAVVRANERAVYRNLINENNWKKWWPAQNNANSQKNTNEFYFNGYSFKTGTKQLDGIEVIIANNDYSTSSLLNLLPMSTDSSIIRWTTTLATSANPFTKLSKYSQAKKIKQSMEELLSHLHSFAEKNENLYGIKITQTKVTDTLLMVIRKEQKEKPTEPEIYANINMLRGYIAVAGAKETNYPMLNISYSNEIKSYQVMVAIPVNKKLEGNTLIKQKRMVAGNILSAEVKGGEATVEEAMKQMENYVFDNQKTSPALSFQLLLTDRIKEKDTAKWVTRIYYPIL